MTAIVTGSRQAAKNIARKGFDQTSVGQIRETA